MKKNIRNKIKKDNYKLMTLVYMLSKLYKIERKKFTFLCILKIRI